MFNQEMCFEMLLFCTKWHKVTLVTFPAYKKTAYKSLVLLFYHQILDPIFLSTCFL